MLPYFITAVTHASESKGRVGVSVITHSFAMQICPKNLSAQDNYAGIRSDVNVKQNCVQIVYSFWNDRVVSWFHLIHFQSG